MDGAVIDVILVVAASGLTPMSNEVRTKTASHATRRGLGMGAGRLSLDCAIATGAAATCNFTYGLPD